MLFGCSRDIARYSAAAYDRQGDHNDNDRKQNRYSFRIDEAFTLFKMLLSFHQLHHIMWGFCIPF